QQPLVANHLVGPLGVQDLSHAGAGSPFSCTYSVGMVGRSKMAAYSQSTSSVSRCAPFGPNVGSVETRHKLSSLGAGPEAWPGRLFTLGGSLGKPFTGTTGSGPRGAALLKRTKVQPWRPSRLHIRSSDHLSRWLSSSGLARAGART